MQSLAHWLEDALPPTAGFNSAPSMRPSAAACAVPSRCAVPGADNSKANQPGLHSCSCMQAGDNLSLTYDCCKQTRRNQLSAHGVGRGQRHSCRGPTDQTAAKGWLNRLKCKMISSQIQHVYWGRLKLMLGIIYWPSKRWRACWFFQARLRQAAETQLGGLRYMPRACSVYQHRST